MGAHAVSILPLRGLGRETPWLSFHPRPDKISGEPEAKKVLFGPLAQLVRAVASYQTISYLFVIKNGYKYQGNYY